MKILVDYKNRLEDVLDEHFPKGKSKSRGKALVLFADAMLCIREVVKAFGGCTKCWGKGYGTSLEFSTASSDFPDHKPITRTKTQLPLVRFCSCPRGTQLQKLWAQADDIIIKRLTKKRV